jgi:arylsulfatase A-like enzyme
MIMKGTKFIPLSLVLIGAGFRLYAQEKPNILWLSCEDIGPILSCYGTKGISTPNIDRLANEGIRYTRAYATVPVSAPSRSSIITGMYPVSIGTQNMRTGNHYAFREPEAEKYKTYMEVRDHRGRNVPEYSAVLPPFVKCFPEYLRIDGYFCTNNAKCDYQFNSPITVWDEVGYNASLKNKPKDQPFFAVFNFEVTHESQIWGNKEHPMLVNTDSIDIPAYYPTIPVVKQDVGRKYSNIVELDRQIGEMLATLEKDGLLENTIIFFWSDHGGPLLRQKRAVGNSGLHVPLIVRYPDKKMAGTVVDDMVSLMDLGPTVLSLAGIEPPEYMHGKAFLGSYKTNEPHKYAFGSADRFDEAFDMTRSVLDGRYVYIRNYYPELPFFYRNKYREQIDMTRELARMSEDNELEGDAAYLFLKTKPEEELYDLQSDPHEVHNLAILPAYSQKLLELRTALADWQMTFGDKGFIDEYDLVQMMWPGLKQPVTDEPVFIIGKNTIDISCSTEGASIAYQINDEIGKHHWNVYHKPLVVKKGDEIVSRAVRIGYKTSTIESLKVE